MQLGHAATPLPRVSTPRPGFILGKLCVAAGLCLIAGEWETEARSIGEALLCWVRGVVQGPGSVTLSLLLTSGWHQLWGRLWNVLGLWGALLKA